MFMQPHASLLVDICVCLQSLRNAPRLGCVHCSTLSLPLQYQWSGPVDLVPAWVTGIAGLASWNADGKPWGMHGYSREVQFPPIFSSFWRGSLHKHGLSLQPAEMVKRSVLWEGDALIPEGPWCCYCCMYVGPSGKVVSTPSASTFPDQTCN